MTYKEMEHAASLAWHRALVERVNGIPRISLSTELGDLLVVFPDGAPVRRVFVGEVDGEPVVIISGELA